MTAPGEQVGPKLVRLLYFVGAGFLCTAAINKYNDWEKKSIIKKQQQLSDNPSSDGEHGGGIRPLTRGEVKDGGGGWHLALMLLEDRRLLFSDETQLHRVGSQITK
ncbi:hypothetical protein Leryth_024068 [Lithospermum erythrorhizon]|nr:hypothetical protein Leryth_024068 [Lithospermum erythrorhizon]